MNFPWKKGILICCGILMLICTINSYCKVKQAQTLKSDLLEISAIQYGLFNVDEWKKILHNLVIKKLDEIEITEENELEIKKDIERLMYQMLDEAEKAFEINQKGVKGWLKKGINNSFGIFKYVKKTVPQHAQSVINFLKNKEKRSHLADFINEKVEEMASSTFSEMDYSLRDNIVSKYNITSIEELKISLKSQYEDTLDKTRWSNYLLFILALALFGALIAWKELDAFDTIILCVLLCIYLFLGLALPMIDIDARIASFSFQMLGEPIIFTDQIIFFKSKSILEVVRVLIGQGKMEVFLVGFLVLTFSVLFPLAKLVSLSIYAIKKAKVGRFNRFLTFQTGKWSMADVFVVALFMAYIGFNGIVSDHLRQLENLSTKVEILTTNNSTLQPGFFFFLTFAILGILLAQKVGRSFQPNSLAPLQKTLSDRANPSI